MTVARDRYGFKLGSAQSQVAAFITAGVPDEDIIKKHFLRQTIHSTRYEMKKRIAKWPNGYPQTADAPNVSASPPANSPNARGATRRQFDTDKYDRHGFKRGSRLSEYAARLAAGETAAQIVEKDKLTPTGKTYIYKAARIMRENMQPKKPAAKTTALVPHQPKHVTAKKKPNGHDAPVPIPMLEVVVHDGRGNEVPIFSSVDVFPHIYQRVLRKLGLG